MTSKHDSATNKAAVATNAGKYRDRPADEGKHGDGADEPNSGTPSASKDTPGRPKESGSRQQTNPRQTTQTGAPEFDAPKDAAGKTPRKHGA